MCESRGGRPGLPVPNNPYDFCGRKATFVLDFACEKIAVSLLESGE